MSAVPPSGLPPTYAGNDIMSLSITSNFDGGAIEVLSCAEAGNIRLRVRTDSHAEFAQWFYFRLSEIGRAHV